MTAIMSKETLDRLVALGRDRGHLTTEDLRNALPVDAMAPDEIALVVVHLEEAGVPVDLDEAFLAPGPRSPTSHTAPDRIELVDSRPEERPASSGFPAGPRGNSDAPAPDLGHRAFGSTHWAVALGGLLALAVLALLIFLAR